MPRLAWPLMAAAEPSGIQRTGPDWALRREFARLLVLAVILPALTLSALFTWRDAISRRDRAGERLQSVAESTARDLDDFLRAHRAAVAELAERRSGENNIADRARWTSDLRRLRRHYPAFRALLVTDAKGGMALRDPPAPASIANLQLGDRAYFTEPKRTREPYVSDALRGRVHNDALVALSAPLYEDGRFAGVIEASIMVDTFAGLRGQWLRERGYEALLLDRSGSVVHASAGLPYAPLDPIGDDAPAQQLRRIAMQPQSPALQRAQGVLRDGGDAYAVAVPLDVGWRLLLLQPKHSLDLELLRNVLALLLLLLLVAAGVFTIAWWQMRRLTGSVRELLERMQRFALDQDSPRIPSESMPRELAPLADAMNQLTSRLGHAYRETSHSLDEQRRLRRSLEQVVGAREREIAQRTQELRTAVSELDRLSRTDALTGCLNYRGFREVAALLWHEARSTDRPLSALALDIDHFKSYNDRYGHQRGDNALKRFAGAVRSALYHREDVVVRPGGEEFIVFLPDTTLEQARGVAERICTSVIHADIAHAGSPIGVVTVSIGVATIEPDDGDDPEVMLGRADAALYRAKNAGRNRISL